MAKVTFEDGTVINFDGKPSPSDIDEAYGSLKGKGSSSQSQQPSTQPKPQSLLNQLGQATMNTPNMLLRGMAEPFIKAFGSAGLGINDMLNLPGKSVQGYDVPFPGGSIPVQRMQTMSQSVGLGLQGGALTIGSPLLGGAMYGGGNAMANQESGVDIAKQAALGAGLGVVGGVATGRYKVGINKTKLAQEATKIYRNILKPTKTEISKIEIGKGGNIDNYYNLAAKEGLPIKKSPDGRLDTREAIGILQEKQAVINEQLNNELAKDTSKSINLNDYSKQAKSILDKRIKNASELKTAKSNIDEFIKAEIERNGGEFLVTAADANRIKSGMWSISFNKFDPIQNAKAVSARTIGYVIKNDIELKFPASKIQSLNKTSGDYATLESLLDNAHARPVAGGKMESYIGRVIGGISGAATPHPVIGSIIGQEVGAKVADVLSNPSSSAKFAAWKMKRALK